MKQTEISINISCFSFYCFSRKMPLMKPLKNPDIFILIVNSLRVAIFSFNISNGFGREIGNVLYILDFFELS